MLNRLLPIFVLASLCLAGCNDDNDDDDRRLSLPPPQEAQSSVVDVARAQDNEFNTLVSALEATGLDATLNDLNSQFTVFAPTDAAFAELGEDTLNNLLADTEALSNILLYHVISGAEVTSSQALASVGDTITMANGQDTALSLSGSTLQINLSAVTAVDVDADNGVIHVIDTVLLPPTAVEDSRLTTNIVETAIDSGNFNSLVTALQASGLDTALAGEGPFTVFAPTDAAFAALPEGSLDDIPALTNILQLHVIPGAEVSSINAFAASGTSVPTLSSQDGVTDNLPIAIVDGVLTVGGANVSSTDIYTSNGVIHVIDSVITSVPKGTPPPIPTESPDPVPSESPDPVPSESPDPVPSESPDPVPSAPPSISLTSIQNDIFSVSCAFSGCHSGATPPQGLLLDTLDNSFNSLVNTIAGEIPTLLRVAPGNPDESYLVRKIEGGPDILGGQMPLNRPPLSAEQKQLIRDWISQGATQ